LPKRHKWKCLVALDQDQLLGGDVLAADDLSSRPDLGPWLACVFVTPSARGTGIAEQLIEAWGKEQWKMSRALR
jgi:GNAT superfamily N-acetyltransferase